MIGKWAGALGIIGVLLFVSGVILGGRSIPGYDHTTQLISESYAMGTPLGEMLRFYMYIPSGICLFLFAVLAILKLPKHPGTTIGLGVVGVCYGLATATVAIFPCDAGCNKEFINPTLSQFIHNLVGALTYLTVPLAVLALGFVSHRWPYSYSISLWGMCLVESAVFFV